VINKQIIIKTFVSISALLIVLLTFTGALDQRGRDYTDSAFNNALITFGIARGINGIISVAQGTEVAIHPAGFGVNFTPGEILDPINDLIERFSWIMLASAASLGIQKIFLDIGSHWLTSVLLVLLLASLILAMWKTAIMTSQTRNLLYKGLLVMMFIRFSIPLSAIGTEYIYNYFLLEQYQEASNKLEETRETIGELSKQQQEELQVEESVIDKAKKIFNSAVESMNIEARIDQYTAAAADASKYTINLIVVFILQTIVLPILFLIIIYKSFIYFSKRLI
jgi:hypothetical protein